MSKLTAVQMRELTTLLAGREKALRAELRAELAETGTGLPDEARLGEVRDQGDVAAEKLAEGLNAAVAGRHIRELREIQAARARMEEGSYGECEHCGADIALERLRAFPAARRCVACQSLHEKTYATEFDAAI